MKEELKRLHELGFALIPLRVKSKAPREGEWTQGARKSWSQFQKSCVTNGNAGVRLGKASRLSDGTFLACIDCDVKKPSAQKAMEKALESFVGDWWLEGAPVVWSGRGGGARHLYVRTKKTFPQWTIAIEEDWQIVAYSEGRQMVLPPSVHPEGGLYRWEKEPTGVSNFPLFDPPVDKYVDKSKDSVTDLNAVKVDLKRLRLSPHIMDLLGLGFESSGDLSGDLFEVSKALIHAGLTDNEIASVCTNPDHFISQAASKRRGSRKSQMQWVIKYNVNKLRSGGERGARDAFSEVATEPKEKVDHPKQDVTFNLSEKKGKLVPDYRALLNHFETLHPYRMIADMKSVYIFNGTHYVDITPAEIKAFAEKGFKPEPEEKVRNEFLNKIQANNVTRRRFFIDSIEDKINFKNGILNLSSGKLTGHSPKYGFRGMLPFDFDPNAECPFFEEWLDGVMLEDQELVLILQEFMGYVIRGGDYKYHKALWLGGKGRNGKSTFIDVLKALIGPLNYTTISIRALREDKFAGADLDGKIANFSEETSPQELSDSGPFKNLTGDGDLLVQKKFGDPYTLRNRAKLIMTYNQIPDLSDLSKGMLSRPVIIPFRRVFKDREQDKEIKKKLFKELSGIFNFALRGWQRLEKQKGFTISKKSEEALKKIKEESCNVFRWVEDHITFLKDPTSGERIRPIDLYSEYRRWEKWAYRSSEFYRRLLNHPKMHNRRIRANGKRRYSGIRID